MTHRTLAAALLGMTMVGPVLAQQGSPVERGRGIATRLCGRCHAIEPSTTSHHAKAPAFHVIAGRYPVEQLAEALAEGILVGHDDMPQFALDPDEIDALLGYMGSLAPPTRRKGR